MADHGCGTYKQALYVPYSSTCTSGCPRKSLGLIGCIRNSSESCMDVRRDSFSRGHGFKCGHCRIAHWPFQRFVVAVLFLLPLSRGHFGKRCNIAVDSARGNNKTCGEEIVKGVFLSGPGFFILQEGPVWGPWSWFYLFWQ